LLPEARSAPGSATSPSSFGNGIRKGRTCTLSIKRGRVETGGIATCPRRSSGVGWGSPRGGPRRWATGSRPPGARRGNWRGGCAQAISARSTFPVWRMKRSEMWCGREKMGSRISRRPRRGSRPSAPAGHSV
jgi:hypothetical protein